MGSIMHTLPLALGSEAMTGANGLATNQLNPFDSLPLTDPVKEMYRIYSALKQDWRVSECGKAVVEAFEKNLFHRPDMVITDAICLGLGEMSGPSMFVDKRDNECSLAQLAAFTCWVDILSKCKVLDGP